jgi:hypothetical protein
MHQASHQKDDPTRPAQDHLRALVRLLARTVAQEFVASSSASSNQEDPADARPPRRHP